MADPDDDYSKFFICDFVNKSLIANSYAVAVLPSFHLLDPVWSGVDLRRPESSDNDGL